MTDCNLVNCVSSKLKSIEKYLGKGKIKVTKLIPKGICATVGSQKKKFCKIWTNNLYIDNANFSNGVVLNTTDDGCLVTTLPNGVTNTICSLTTSTGILEINEELENVINDIIAYQYGNIVIISGCIVANSAIFGKETILLGTIIGLPNPTIPVFQSLSIFDQTEDNRFQIKLEYPHLLGSQVELYIYSNREGYSSDKIYVNGSYILSAPP
jgi:hypothetical protein